MAEEIGVAFVRLVPSMRGFGPEASRAMNNAATGPAGDAGRQAGGRFAGAFKMALLGAGVLAGAALVGGITEALDQGKITGRLGAQLGSTPAEAQKYGKIAGQLFSKGVTQDFQGAADAIKATMSAGIAPPGATTAQLEKISTKAADLASTFEVDLGQATNAVGQILKTGLAKNADEAFDIMTRGFQVMGPRADDLADTFNEYSIQFKNMGLSAEMATGILAQGMKAGARDTDLVADTIKEFSIEAVAGGKRVRGGFESIGLSADGMVKKFAAGGPTAAAAFDTVLDKLRGIEDPAKRNAVAIELFGTKAEDMGAALFALDPSKAVADLGQVAGASDRLGTSLRDNAGAQLTAFTRGMQQGLVEFLGAKVVPVLVQAGQGFQTHLLPPIKSVASAVGTYLMPPLKTFGSWLKDNPAAVRFIGGVIVGILVPAMILMGITATVAAGRVVVGWVTTGATALASAATQVLAGASVVAGWILMGVQSMIQAARMAAAWFIAMGPVGWVIAAIVALAALIFLNWDKIKKYTAMAWDWVWGKIKGIGQFILDYIIGWKLVSFFLRHWDSIKTGVARKALELVAWVRGLPGRITSALGSLGSLLHGKGMDLIRGLWNGIKSMGSWLKGQLMSFARNMIPGPIAKALGIGSPSKLMADEIGHWIPAGIAVGWENNLGAVAAMGEHTAAASMLPAGAGHSTAGTAAAAGTTVVIDGTAMPRALLEWLKNAVRTDGQGSVQTLLGQPGR